MSLEEGASRSGNPYFTAMKVRDCLEFAGYRPPFVVTLSSFAEGMQLRRRVIEATHDYRVAEPQEWWLPDGTGYASVTIAEVEFRWPLPRTLHPDLEPRTVSVQGEPPL